MADERLPTTSTPISKITTDTNTFASTFKTFTLLLPYTILLFTMFLHAVNSVKSTVTLLLPYSILFFTMLVHALKFVTSIIVRFPFLCIALVLRLLGFVVSIVRGVVSPVFTRTARCVRRYWTKGCHLQIKISRRQKGKGAVVAALVDTGAAFTVIRKDVFETFAPMSTLAPQSTVGIDALRDGVFD